jgi:hypothetical protein
MAKVGVNVSAGTLQANTGTVVLSNSNSVSFGMSFGSSSWNVTGNAVVGAAIALSAGTALISTGEAVFSNSNGIAFGVNGQTLTAGFVNTSYWSNYPGDGAVLRIARESTVLNMSFQPVIFWRPLTATRADVLGHLSVGGSTAGSFTLSMALYTMSGSTASLVSSATAAVTWSSGTATSATSQYAGQSGTRFRSIALGTWNITPGQYLLGMMGSISGVAGTTGNLTLAGRYNMYDSGGTTALDYFGYGYYTTGTPSLPTSVVPSQIQGQIVADGIITNGMQPFVQLAGTF